MTDGITGAPASQTSPALRVETVRVEAAADRGMAMGRLGGKVVFVSFGAPGDLLEVAITREHSRHAEARILRILEPSPLRRPPPCPHFGVCGGCQWQHLPYAEQLSAKDKSFRGLLGSRLGLRPETFRPPVPSVREWGYRSRVGLKVRAAGGAVALGYFAPRSHRIVPVRSCPIAHPAIERLLEPLRSFLQGFEPARGGLPQIDLQADGQDRVWAVFQLLRPLSARASRALGAFADGSGLATALTQTGRKQTLSPLFPSNSGARSLPLTLSAGGRLLRIQVAPGSFLQANPAVNQALVDLLLSLSDLYAGQPALDLYCGAGNFTLPLALSASEVLGVEGYPPAARDAERNAHGNGLHHVRVLASPVPEGLRAAAAEGLHPRFALLDPPREGARDALTGLAALDPEWVLYVSCAPPTLARDLGILGGLGYRVLWTRIADMFPQTAHTESVTLLRRHGPVERKP